MKTEPNQSGGFFAQIRSWALNRVRSFDQHQGGAVAILCLAACIILLMVAFVLYDTGYTARGKLDTQTAADTAAYSQAAVKARSMNMIMYTNVAKRSIVSLHNMYHGMWVGYVAYMAIELVTCIASYGTKCTDFFKNLPIFLGEGLGDYSKFNDEVMDYYTEEIEALDAYQTYMTALTPWWAWSEALIRGSRNRASIASSFPPPEGIQSNSQHDWAKNALQQHSISIESEATGLTDSLPLEKGSKGDTCVGFGDILSGANLAEHGVNLLIHITRSEEGGKGVVTIALGLVAALSGVSCSHAKNNFGDAMAPRKPTANSDSGPDLLKKSNIVFAYKHSPEVKDRLRKNFNFVNKEYTTSIPLKDGSGMWNLSRGEFFFKDDGGDEPDPWTAKWTAKVRPVSLDGEFDELGNTINEMFHDVAPYMGLGMRLTGTGTDNSAKRGDAVFLEKATRSLDNGVINGLSK